MTTLTDDARTKLAGVTVASNSLIPEGKLYGLGESVVFVGPLTFWSLAHEGRYPMHSRYSLGMIELERDRRRSAETEDDGVG